MNKGRKLALSVLLFVSIAAVTRSSGQAVFGGIAGTVTDPSGASIPSAKVSIRELSSRLRRILATRKYTTAAQVHTTNSAKGSASNGFIPKRLSTA